MSTKRIRKLVATYGVALATLAGAEAAEGAVVDLTPNPGSLPYSSTSATGATITLGVGGLSFFQYNDSTGKSLSAYAGSITGFRSASSGSSITTGQSFASFLSISTDPGNGTVTYAFRTTLNTVGWIRMKLGFSQDPVIYLSAAFNNTPGGSIVAGVGASPIPEPGTAALFGLGLLAMGAAGVRKMRKKT